MMLSDNYTGLWLLRWSVLLSVLFIGQGTRAVELESPPSELTALNPHEVPLFDIPDLLHSVDAERLRIQEEMNQLPSLAPPLQTDAYGYHGGYLPALDELPEEPRWVVDIQFHEAAPIHQAILVPAIDRRFSGFNSYGFPRRFRMSQVLPDGSTRVAKEWMEEDCPDSGRIPLIIDLPEPWQRRLRIEVFRGALEEGKEFFALDEFFGIAKNEAYIASVVKMKRKFESLPYWSRKFLVDHKTGLGLPVGAATQDGQSDYVVQFDSEPVKPCIIELDLGKNCPLGWVALYPAIPPEGIIIPGYGFPENFEIKMIGERSNGTRVQRGNTKKIYKGNPGNNLIRIAGNDRKCRWIQLKVSGFPVQNGNSIFSLGEIHVGKAGTTFPVEKVKIQGFPAGAEEKTDLLVDMKSSGRPVIFLTEWMHQLRSRHELELQFQQCELLLKTLDARWNRFWEIFWIASAGVLFALALAIAVVAVFLRIRGVRRLRWQITRDLHDQVGSSLGSISLTAEEIASYATENEVKEDLDELGLMAREAYASLMDVVWLNDTVSIRLPKLVQRLVSRAERTLRGVDIVTEIQADIPNDLVSWTFKRHLIMFFREVVYNCARHSEASTVWLQFSVEQAMMKITVRDNGCGFSMDQVSGGWGLESLHKRAKEMGGRMDLSSAPKEGTKISLVIPLKLMPRDPSPAYKTSN